MISYQLWNIIANKRRIQKSEVRSQNTEVRSQESGVRIQKSEFRSQNKVEDAYGIDKDGVKMDIQEDAWVWVVIQDPGGNEMFLGQHDEVNDISFIPAFLDKGDAQSCLGQLVREEGERYEVQAIKFGLLAQYSAENGFKIFILNANGEVLQRIKETEKG